jgi:hypothetical protein
VALLELAANESPASLPSRAATLLHLTAIQRLFCSLLDRNWLRNFADEEWLKIRLVASLFKARNRLPVLTPNEASLTVGAGYFKLAGLALQGPGNVIGIHLRRAMVC